MKEWEAAYIAGIIDGEGSISLTRMHENEHRRPCISIASTDKELLCYIQTLTGGIINNKKNYNPSKHKNSYALTIKNKEDVFFILKQISRFLRVDKKRARAKWILDYYEGVTLRNGKYNAELLKRNFFLRKRFFK